MDNIKFKNMSQFPIGRLKDDLAECKADIALCKKAMSAGVTYYSGKSVGKRLSFDTLLQRAIEEELSRREL